MKALHCDKFSPRMITLAIQGVLVGVFAVPLDARADGDTNDDVTALTQPKNSVEIGAEYVPAKSAKFGEYNGLNKNAADLIGNFSVRGGDAYKAFDGGDGTTRWEVKGNDLGTTSREVGGNISNQGKWSLGIGYDELQHNYTDTYQTPLQGGMGGNNFTLPSNFGTINTSTTSGTPLTARGANVMTPAQLADLMGNTPDVHTKRDTTTFNAKYIYDSNWNASFDFSHLKQSGAKLMGVAGDQVNGVTTATVSPAGQTPLVIMNPTNYTTDNFNAALNWVGDKSFVSVGYYGSLFQDGYNGVSFGNPFVKNTVGVAGTSPNLLDTMSTMPDNQFHQFNLNGGYTFTPETKLVGGISYARNTQNDIYANTGLNVPGFVEPGSLNGLVITTHADLKLTNQTTKDLMLSAGLKYNERNNETPSSLYEFYTINQAATLANIQTTINAPMSNKQTQLELAGDYRIDKSQKLRLSYEYDAISRWCNNAVPNTLNAPNLGATGVLPYIATTCAEVPDSTENKLAANYKLIASESLNFNAGYGYSTRNATVTTTFYNPMQAIGNGAGGEGFEVPGFLAYFQQSRVEQFVKAGVNWQATDKWAFSGSGRFTDDNYGAQYGVQQSQSVGLNVDATYSQSETSSTFAYATVQNSHRDMKNLQSLTATNASATALNVPIGATWNNKLKENDITLGIGTKKGGLMDGKLELTGDLSYSAGSTGYGTAFNYVSATTGGLTCASPQFYTCGNLPDINSQTIALKLVGNYKLDKASSVRVGYLYQRLKSNDYFYNVYQYGTSSTSMLPTNQMAPNYTINVVSVVYAHSF